MTPSSYTFGFYPSWHFHLLRRSLAFSRMSEGPQLCEAPKSMRTPVLEARGLSVVGSLLRYGKRERTLVEHGGKSAA